MQALQAYISKVAVTDSHVLITGETGTGKELDVHFINPAPVHYGVDNV
jgi:DNA-binding NtrC family response regulator